MNKGDLIESLASTTGESKATAEKFLNAFTETVESQVTKGEKVQLPGFGTFERRDRSARTGRNPQTGEEIKIKATKVPAFKPGAGFKSTVAGK
jgi:DNA-binding protein HU-beta